MKSATGGAQAQAAETTASVLPLATLLSHVLVAFTIEFDNESEHRMPHRTTSHGATAGSLHAPWLVSLVMWSNCMRFVGADGVRVHELERLARTATNLNGMERWGYIVVEPDPADARPKPPHGDWLIRATPAGRKAQDVWRPLFGDIEERWRGRFGEHAISDLRESLRALIDKFEIELPECLPILGYGLFSKGPTGGRSSTGERADASRLALPALLSKVLLMFAIEFERESDLSVAICANVVRIIAEKGVRVRDVPVLSGVSKAAIRMSLGFLKKGRYIVVEPDPTAPRAKLIRLTAKGQEARENYQRLLRAIEKRWEAQFGQDNIRNIREALEKLVGESTAELSPLLRGLKPYSDGWRASSPIPKTLPHYPMVLHRGGFPDGS